MSGLYQTTELLHSQKTINRQPRGNEGNICKCTSNEGFMSKIHFKNLNLIVTKEIILHKNGPRA